MREFRRYWSSNNRRHHLLVRTYAAYRWWEPWRWFGRWARNYWSFSFRRYQQTNGECYCPEGREARFGITAFGLSVAVWYSQTWTVRPCSCDKVYWLLFPSDHADEIEEYGESKLKAEFPEVMPL